MKVPKTLAVAKDVNPTNAFMALSEWGQKENPPVVVDLALGEIGGQELLFKMTGTEVFLLGMSSSEKLAKNELTAAGYASKSQKPLGFFSDATWAFNRGWFTPYREGASFVCVLRQKEIPAAQALFPNAIIRAVGHPKWAEYPAVKMSQYDVYQKLGIDEGRPIVLIPGCKVPEINLEVMRAAASLVNESDFGGPPRFAVVFSKHPGDTTSTDYYVTARPPNVQVVDKTTITSGLVLRYAGLYLNINSTDVDEAAFHKVKTICFMSDSIRARRQNQFNREVPEEHEDGIAELAEGHNLAEVVRNLWFDPNQQREAQRRYWSTPPMPGAFERLVMGTILDAWERQNTKT